MNSLDLSTIIAITQTMLGGLFYPLLILAIILTVALLVLLFKEKGIVSKRFMQAQMFAIVGGAIGVWVMLILSESSITDIGGPIDWFVFFATYAVNFFGFAILIYTLLGWLRRNK